jgi:hypothetical protein
MEPTVVGSKSTTEKATDSQEKEIQELTDVFIERLPSFYAQAMRRLGNEADTEDAVQDAFLSAYTHVNQFRGQAQMSTWLTAIVINSVSPKRCCATACRDFDRDCGNESAGRQKLRLLYFYIKDGNFFPRPLP